MKGKKYEKPLMAVEFFTPNDFVTACDLCEAVYNESGNNYIYNGSNHSLYLDKNDNSRYNNGEQIDTPYPSSDTFTFSFKDNKDLNYAMNSLTTGNPVFRNIKGFTTHKYYREYKSNNNKYVNTSEVQSLYALKSTDNITYYFNTNAFTITKLHS